MIRGQNDLGLENHECTPMNTKTGEPGILTPRDRAFYLTGQAADGKIHKEKPGEDLTANFAKITQMGESETARR
jgi:hypothetical protein